MTMTKHGKKIFAFFGLHISVERADMFHRDKVACFEHWRLKSPKYLHDYWISLKCFLPQVERVRAALMSTLEAL